MTSEASATPVPVPSVDPETPAVPAASAPADASLRRRLRAIAGVAVAAVLGMGLLWHKLGNIQEQLALQTAESGAQSSEARATAKQAQELAIETAAKLAVLDARLSEVALQRAQLEELMQSLSRSRDENLVVDIESSLRLAQQQAQLTGSVEPLLAALKSAELRVSRAAQPRLTPLLRAIGKDIARIKGTALADTPALLVQLDELVALADEMPLGNSVRPNKPRANPSRSPEETWSGWWGRMLQAAQEELRSLVRISTIDSPEAALLSPEQSFFVRENVKLTVLNARLGLLSRQVEAARADMASASNAMQRYFDTSSRKTQAALGLASQVQSQMRALEIPRVDETFAALATAAAGR